jgi:adenylate kinase
MASIIFIGGVHGVGKTTFCKPIALEVGFEHVTASLLIKERKASAINDKSKAVQSVDDNQKILIAAIDERRSKGKNLLIDGHFTLLTPAGKIALVDVLVFEKIAPTSIAVLTDAPEAIWSRIKQRDGWPYPRKKLNDTS